MPICKVELKISTNQGDISKINEVDEDNLINLINNMYIEIN